MIENHAGSGATVTTTAGQTIAYTAQWVSHQLRGPHGAPDATISATTYVAEPADQDRPVTFLFNGGPGASSVPLHMNAFGPRIFGTDGSGQRIVKPNAHTLLGCSDLVFIDPVGTGFNRELRPGGEEPYLTVHGDAAGVEQLIRWWLVEHQRTNSPIYLVGESYGGFRLATMCETITDLPVAGLVFVSPLLDASARVPAVGNDLPYVFELPTMAVAAWLHGKAFRGVPEVASVFETARAFAQDDYLRALHRGSQLADDEYRRIGAELATLLGLPIEQILAAGLRVDSDDFLSTLLVDRGELVGRLDTRTTGPLPTPADDGRPLSADDPALGLGRSNVRHSEETARYLREEVGATVDGPYTSLSLDLHFRFDYRSADTRPGYEQQAHYYRNPTVHVARLLAQHPQASALVVGGYFDLATPLLANVHAITHSGLPAERVGLLPLAAGHSIEPATLPETAAALERLVRAGSA